MEPHYLENMVGALAKDPVWFAIYVSVILVMISMLVGTKTIVRFTILLCVLPTLRSIRRGDADIFWARYWMIVGLVSNFGLPSSVRAGIFIWCCAPHAANGTNVIFALISKFIQASLF
ncbi:uncharacterized protein LOC100900212 [Galendromus occidentalis]|uniref:Uncharacterized protein LOC100900212 n=1 Tax=Galendromus occidentalis TaxID=34638 RepID=A0AAJ6QW79_9ACAR|nr:uncharacterized protein LOC100900212 [Galendromus occidentalis]